MAPRKTKTATAASAIVLADLIGCPVIVDYGIFNEGEDRQFLPMTVTHVDEEARTVDGVVMTAHPERIGSPSPVVPIHGVTEDKIQPVGPTPEAPADE